MSANQAPLLTTAAGNGIVTMDLGAFSASAATLVLQADGKIIVNANAWNLSASVNYSELIRYNADGSLDSSFGTDGVVWSRTDLIESFSAQPGAALQADGKIVVGGNGFAVTRYNPDGSFDTSFGAGGQVFSSQFGSSMAYGIVVEPDGKIIASGDGSRFGLARFDSAGNLDSSFGIGGKVTTSFSASGSSRASSLIAQPDGKLVVAGSVNGQGDFGLARYTSDGSLDAGFGNGGKVTTDFGASNDAAFSATLQDDGKIVLAGITGLKNLALARYNADGSLDTSFGAGGKVTTSVVSDALQGAQSVRIQPDGKIVVAGYSAPDLAAKTDFALVRYNSDGSLDTSFGAGGKVLTDLGSAAEHATSMVIEPDGRILVVGTSSGSGVSPTDIVLVRYNSDGSLDTSFGAASALDGSAFFIEDQSPTVLNPRATVHDAELAAAGAYGGASLTLARQGGANSDDVFGASGNLDALAQGGNIMLSGVAIGTVTHNSGGMLVLTFGAAATEARVDEAMRDITYMNASDTPASSARIGWSFSDGNTGAQGSGGALTATGLTIVNITAANDAPVNTVPDALSTLADRDLAVAGLSVSDPDSASLSTVLGVDHGTLAVAAAGGATVTGSGTDQVRITGSAAQIDATLGASNNVLYHSAADFSGADTLTMTTFDGTGAGSAMVSSTVAVTVTTAPGSLSINDVTVAEGDSGARVATFTVTRSGGTAPIAVDFATADGGATTADSDYVATSGTLNFGAGVYAQTISVTVNGDTKLEPNETFSVHLSGATNGAAITDSVGAASISNDDAVGAVSIGNVTVAEGDAGSKVAAFTVTRSGGMAAFDVDFATADGAATTADHDYIATAGTLHFGAGINTQTISVAVNGDTRFEPNETFSVHLSGATGGTITDAQGAGTVQNDDLNRAPRDFTADGTSDVLWRDNSGGDVGVWVMKDGAQNWQDLGGSGTDHKVAGIGDFNGDGAADLFWRNDTTGHVGIWEMHNDMPSWHDLGGSGVDHKVVGIGDFNGDGTADVLWRNDATGHTGLWEMHNNVQSWYDLGGSGTDHKVVGVGDFNGDQTSDVLWRNDSTGHVGIWEMHNGAQSWVDLGGSGVDHKVVGIGDFNGDGTSDILWRNDASGHVGIWEMHNDVQTWHDLGGSGVDHKVVGIGDYNGDGTSDIFWRNDASGHTGIWEMHNNVPTWHDLGGSGVDHSFIV